MDRDDYARWLQLKLHQTFAAPPRDGASDVLMELASRAEAAIVRSTRRERRKVSSNDAESAGPAV